VVIRRRQGQPICTNKFTNFCHWASALAVWQNEWVCEFQQGEKDINVVFDAALINPFQPVNQSIRFSEISKKDSPAARHFISLITSRYLLVIKRRPPPVARRFAPRDKPRRGAGDWMAKRARRHPALDRCSDKNNFRSDCPVRDSRSKKIGKGVGCRLVRGGNRWGELVFVFNVLLKFVGVAVRDHPFTTLCGVVLCLFERQLICANGAL